MLISRDYYAHLQTLEDELWALRALLAEQRGYISVEETARVLKDELLPEDETAC